MWCSSASPPQRGGEVEGALVVGPAPDHAPEADRSELHTQLLLTSRLHAGRGTGARLIRRAVQEASEHGFEQLRVDCWADAPSLVTWYGRNGFLPSGTFTHNGWRGQILTMPLEDCATSCAEVR